MQGIGDAVEYGKTAGWSSLAMAFFKKARSFLFVKEEFILSYMTLDSVPPVKPEMKVLIRDAAPSDLPKLKKIKFNTGEFSDWLRRGCTFIIALDGGKVASYMSMHTKPLPPFDKVVKLKPDEIWGIYAYTAPEYRGKKIYPSLAHFATRRMIKNGYKGCYGVVRTDNKTSIRVHDRMGKKDLTSIIHLKVLGIHRCWIKKKGVEK
jgi:hypothetical protein